MEPRWPPRSSDCQTQDAARELLGRKDLSMTMIYTHVLNRGWGAIRNPANSLLKP